MMARREGGQVQLQWFDLDKVVPCNHFGPADHCDARPQVGAQCDL
jgi:hypothetical protein